MIMATLRLIHKRTTEKRRDRNGPKRTRTKNQQEPKEHRKARKGTKKNPKNRKEPEREPTRTEGTQK